jgi:hypothetical protein
MVLLTSFQCEIKCGPLPFPPFRPNAAAVSLDDTLHDRQTHPGALEFLGPMQPLKDLKQLP